MATATPIKRAGNRGNVPLTPPFKYVDDYSHEFWLEALTPIQNKDFEVQIMRLKVSNDPTYLNYGPFEISSIRADRAIVSAFAHPFVFGFANQTNPSASDLRVVRPIFAIRGPRELEFLLALNTGLTAIPDITGNTGIDPVVEAPVGKHLAGDFFTDYAKSERGASPNYNIRGTIIWDVQNDGADPSNPTTHTLYQLMLSNGGRKRVGVLNSATAPQVGDPYPLTQEDGRFTYDVGEAQFEQDRLYPKRNMHNVPDRSSVADHNQIKAAYNNPYAIQAVQQVYDFPSNPTTLIKKVTLVNGTTTTVPLSTPTVIGEEIGDGTSTAPLQDDIDVQKYVCFDAFIITAPALPDETLDGIAADVWPLPTP